MKEILRYIKVKMLTYSSRMSSVFLWSLPRAPLLEVLQSREQTEPPLAPRITEYNSSIPPRYYNEIYISSVNTPGPLEFK